MIDKGKDIDGLETYDVSCDVVDCINLDHFEVVDWGHLLDEMGDRGWYKKTSGGMCAHICPACAEKM